MTRVGPEGGMQIGGALRQARTRQGLDLGALEERTKIRTRYLRALENEDWETLPSPAYTKGFLRTYGQALGLDSEALVDEYRRQVESTMPQEHPYPISEPLLEGRRRPGEPRGWRPGARVTALAAGAVIAVLSLIGLVGGDDEGESGQDRRAARQAVQERRQVARRRERRQERRAEHQGKGEERQQQAKELTLRLELNSELQVCLVGADSSQPLIDDQVLTGGSTEGPYTAKRFYLRFPYGYDVEQLDLFLNGRRVPLRETSGPIAYEIVAPRQLRTQDATSGCP